MKLKEIRQKEKMSRKELAEKLGVSVHAIGHYENGLRIPPRQKVVQIADIFGISRDDVDFGNLDDDTA